jgi:hypothetical protein
MISMLRMFVVPCDGAWGRGSIEDAEASLTCAAKMCTVPAQLCDVIGAANDSDNLLVYYLTFVLGICLLAGTIAGTLALSTLSEGSRHLFCGGCFVRSLCRFLGLDASPIRGARPSGLPQDSPDSVHSSGLSTSALPQLPVFEGVVRTRCASID